MMTFLYILVFLVGVFFVISFVKDFIMLLPTSYNDFDFWFLFLLSLTVIILIICFLIYAPCHDKFL